jgi:pyrimidine deaminase RibD-like protein
MKTSDFEIRNTDKLDVLLGDCIEQLFKKQHQDSEHWGLVAAAILDPDNRVVFGVNHITPEGTRKHAERVAIENYTERWGKIPPGCVMVTTLSPCSEYLDERWGESCTELINNSPIKKVYAGWSNVDGDDPAIKRKRFHLKTTRNKKLFQLCGMIGKLAMK